MINELVYKSFIPHSKVLKYYVSQFPSQKQIILKTFTKTNWNKKKVIKSVNIYVKNQFVNLI